MTVEQPAPFSAKTPPEVRAIAMQDFLAGQGPEAPAILADLDGCLISGNTVLPDVPTLVERAGDRLWVVSNNSSDTAITLSARLAAIGLPIPPKRIFLAGESAIRDLARCKPGAQVALFLSQPLRDLARELGLQEGPRLSVAVLGRDPDFTLSDLERLIRLLHGGVPLWVTNPDLTHPSDDGTPVPETGAIFAALQAAVPDLQARIGGKPSPDMLNSVLSLANVSAANAIFLGDTQATDGVAAQSAGVPFVLLRRPNSRSPQT